MCIAIYKLIRNKEKCKDFMGRNPFSLREKVRMRVLSLLGFLTLAPPSPRGRGL
jgi:hypothetical protein